MNSHDESSPTKPNPEDASAREPLPPLRRLSRFHRVVLLPSIAVVFGLSSMQAKTLWEEWRLLRIEQYDDVHSRVVGYRDVTPDFSYANPPEKWVEDEGDQSRLWGGWDRKANRHLWFTFKKGDIDPRHLTHPMGRDAIRAIDHPIIENRGGAIWEFIPPDNLVVVGEFGELPIAYPLSILDKVAAINDTLFDRPLLVVHTPFLHNDGSVEMYDASPDGKTRLTMGHSGYLWDRKPLLFDREGENLWVPELHGLLAVAGPRKGTVLARLAQLRSAHWGEWSAEHPTGRLVVGADRQKPKANP